MLHSRALWIWCLRHQLISWTNVSSVSISCVNSLNVQVVTSGIPNEAKERMPLEIQDLGRLGEYHLQPAWREQYTHGAFVQSKSCQISVNPRPTGRQVRHIKRVNLRCYHLDVVSSWFWQKLAHSRAKYRASSEGLLHEGGAFDIFPW